MLEVKGLHKSFGGFRAVTDVSFDVARQQIAAVIGPNGAGKSTLFNLISGHLRPDSGSVRLAGRELALTVREFDLLWHLVRHPGRVSTREDLMRRVWGWEFGDLSTVTVHVRRLRAKVEADPARPVRLVTVWGVGYRWDAAADAELPVLPVPS